MIVGFDKGIGSVVIGVLHMLAEILEVAKASLDQPQGHAIDGECLREWVALVNSPANPLIVEPIIDSAVLKFIAVDEQGTGDIGGGGTVIQSGGRGGMDEKTVRPCRAGQ